MSNDKLKFALFLLRIGVFITMAIWCADKFLNPSHAAKVWEVFYRVPGLDSAIIYGIGVVQALLILGFLVGYRKTLTYGAVLLMHAISTFSSYQQYLNPFDGPNLLFFAAWPMLSACAALFLLRDRDTLLAIH